MCSEAGKNIVSIRSWPHYQRMQCEGHSSHNRVRSILPFHNIAMAPQTVSLPSQIPFSIMRNVLHHSRTQLWSVIVETPATPHKYPQKHLVPLPQSLWSQCGQRTCTKPTTDTHANNALRIQFFNHLHNLARRMAEFSHGNYQGRQPRYNPVCTRDALLFK